MAKCKSRSEWGTILLIFDWQKLSMTIPSEKTGDQWNLFYVNSGCANWTAMLENNLALFYVIEQIYT